MPSGCDANSASESSRRASENRAKTSPSNGPVGPAAARGGGDEGGTNPRVSTPRRDRTELTMKVPHKDRWKATASSGDPRRAIDDRYATTWKSKPAKKPWLKIDLGKTTTLAGLEVYWGQEAPTIYGFKSSLDGKRWTASLSYSPRRGRTGRLCLPSGRGAIRALGLRRPSKPSEEWRSSRSTSTVPPTRRR